MDDPSRLSVKALPLAEAAQLWDAFSPDDCYGVAQSRRWAETWAEKVNPEIYCSVIFERGAPILMLPVEVVEDKTCRLARYIGGSHANANFPLLRTDSADMMTAGLAKAVLKALPLAVPKLDAVILGRQQAQISGIDNPFSALPSDPSPNLALSFALDPDFEQLIKHRSGARKLKKMRQQARRMDERGGWDLAVAQSDAEAGRMLEAFFVMKAKRFEEFGLKNTFELQEVQGLFQGAFQPWPSRNKSGVPVGRLAGWRRNSRGGRKLNAARNQYCRIRRSARASADAQPRRLSVPPDDQARLRKRHAVV